MIVGIDLLKAKDQNYWTNIIHPAGMTLRDADFMR